MSDFEVRNAEIERLLRDLGVFIGSDLPAGWGFTLFLFSFGDGGSTFYVSNAKRGDMLKALVEFIMRQHAAGEEGGQS